MGRFDLPYRVSSKGHVVSPRPVGVKKLKIPQRLFFLQGYPGTGKSTVISNVLQKLRDKHPNLRVQGFYQKELLRNGQNIGVETVSVNGPRKILTSTYPIPNCMTNPPPFLKKHRVDVNAFESVALPEFKLHCDTELFVLDEVGERELMSKSFSSMLEEVLNAEVPIMGALARPRYWEAEIRQVEAIKKRKDIVIYKVYERTRNHVAKKLHSRINLFYLYRKEEGRDQLKRNH